MLSTTFFVEEQIQVGRQEKDKEDRSSSEFMIFNLSISIIIVVLYFLFHTFFVEEQIHH